MFKNLSRSSPMKSCLEKSIIVKPTNPNKTLILANSIRNHLLSNKPIIKTRLRRNPTDSFIESFIIKK